MQGKGERGLTFVGSCRVTSLHDLFLHPAAHLRSCRCKWCVWSLPRPSRKETSHPLQSANTHFGLLREILDPSSPGHDLSGWRYSLSFGTACAQGTAAQPKPGSPRPAGKYRIILTLTTASWGRYCYYPYFTLEETDVLNKLMEKAPSFGYLL